LLCLRERNTSNRKEETIRRKPLGNSKKRGSLIYGLIRCGELKLQRKLNLERGGLGGGKLQTSICALVICMRLEEGRRRGKLCRGGKVDHKQNINLYKLRAGHPEIGRIKEENPRLLRWQPGVGYVCLGYRRGLEKAKPGVDKGKKVGGNLHVKNGG